jgi:hypothetical protein
MTSSPPTAAEIFLGFSGNKLLNQYWPRLRATVEPLTPEQIWWHPNQASNSIGNLMLHLNGNVGQWLVASFNRQPDHRDRPAEFNETRMIPAAELLEKLTATLEQSARVLARLTEAELLSPYDIQGYHVTGLEAIYQVVEHFGLHYGQITFIAKCLTNRDLAFYPELNKTGRAD